MRCFRSQIVDCEEIHRFTLSWSRWKVSLIRQAWTSSGSELQVAALESCFWSEFGLGLELLAPWAWRGTLHSRYWPLFDRCDQWLIALPTFCSNEVLLCFPKAVIRGLRLIDCWWAQNFLRAANFDVSAPHAPLLNRWDFLLYQVLRVTQYGEICRCFI